MIIDASYLRNKLVLPQTSTPEGTLLVTAFIKQYEKEFLICALGLNLWRAFVEGIEDSAPEDRWVWLLKGQNYGLHNTWPGFQNDDKESPIANYVYYQFLDGKATDYTLTGNVVSETDNNRTVNSMDKMVDCWNRMVDMNTHLIGYLKANKSLYPEWRDCYYLSHDYSRCGHTTACAYRGCANNVFRKKTSFDI